MKRSSILYKSFSQESKNLLAELENLQESNALNTKKLLELLKKSSKFTKFVIFLLLIIISCFIFMSKVYLDMMVMSLNELESIKEFLLRK